MGLNLFLLFNFIICLVSIQFKFEMYCLFWHLCQRISSDLWRIIRHPTTYKVYNLQWDPRSPFWRKTVVISNLCISCSAMRMSSRSEMTSCRCSGKHIPGVGTSLVGFFKLNTWFIRSLLYIWVSRYLDR